MPSLRVLILGIEALFTVRFWTLSGDGLYGMPEMMCLWPRETRKYSGLCTHVPTTEVPIGDFKLTAGELVDKAKF